jgi:hypothetical protein
MQESKRPPYATAVEVIRVIANSINTKFSNKTMDDMALKTDVDYRTINQFIVDSIQDPIARNAGEGIAEYFGKSAEKLIKDYLLTVSSVSFDGVPRGKSITILLENFFHRYAAEFLLAMQSILGGPKPVFLLDSNERSIKTVLAWIVGNEGGWKQFLQGCTKEQKDRISTWNRGNDLPTVQYIGLLQTWSKGPWPENINWPRVRALLIIARALDWGRNQKLGVVAIDAIRKAVWSHEGKNIFPDIVKQFQEKSRQRFGKAAPLISLIQRGLLRTSIKRFSDKGDLFQSIRKARNILNTLDRDKTVECWLDWHEARWYVLSGNLDCACEYYKRAFEGSLYRSGDNQRLVIEEALVVAASLPRPDKVFLKRLKNMAITLGYDIPSVPSSGMSGANKASDFIEDWEVDLWEAHFDVVFPGEGFFPGAKRPLVENRKGPLIFSCDAEVKPDFRYPNRKIKIGDTWKKAFPQLIWFLLQEKKDIVKELLDRGADVNVLSDSDETPIVIALESIDVFFPTSSMDDSFINLILECEHKPETLNIRTSKRRVLPIISAVRSGRPDVVKKLIDMGADPNKRGETDEQTALNVCLKCLAMVRFPERFWENQNLIQMAPETLDSFRRHSAGIAGYTLKDQKEYLERLMSDPRHENIFLAVRQFLVKKIDDNLSVESLREIARLLLDYGADPNAEHTFPIPGYTPLMSASELDESEMFALMVEKGGDPKKFYKHPLTGQKIDCKTIARGFSSKGVCRLLGLKS